MGAVVTPWHPVLIKGEWAFPAEVGVSTMHRCHAVYNLLLSRGHVVELNGVQAVTLGHGLQGPVVGHSFLGDYQQVQQSLSKLSVGNGGIVHVTGMDRSRATGLVCGFF